MKKIKTMKRMIVVLAMCFLCAGCSNDSNEQKLPNTKQGEENIEKEYKETSITLPEGKLFCMSQDSAGVTSAYLFGANSEYASYQKYTYTDKEWVLDPLSDLNKALEKEKCKVLYGFYEGDKDKLYFIKTILSSNKKEQARYEWYSWNGEKVTKEKNILYTKDDNGEIRFNCIQVLEDKSILIAYQNGQMILFDENGNELKKYKKQYGQFAKNIGGVIYSTSTDYQNIILLDSQTEEEMCRIPFEVSQTGIDFAEGDEGSVFAISESGIFKIDEMNKSVQEVINGSKFSVYALKGTDSMIISSFAAKNDVFIANYMHYGENSRTYNMFEYSK